MKASECPYPECLFCLMRDNLSPSSRRSKLTRYFKQLPNSNEPGQVLALSGLWNVAMLHPCDGVFVEAGVLDCMSALIVKCIQNRRWLAKEENVYIPYYAAHVIGSYTMVIEEFALAAVKAGVISPLVEMLKGAFTWVEQRVALRALGHLASYEKTLPFVLEHKEILEVVMGLAEDSVDIVYTQFYKYVDCRVEYHRNLLTRGLGGIELESRKAEEWASQLQCWSLQLINSFAVDDEFLKIICSRKEFMCKLLSMWGGVMNETSPAGVGLLHSLCRSKTGREAVAECPKVVEGLCNVARSSDDWQDMAVDCLIWLVQDPSTVLKVPVIALRSLVDLAEVATNSSKQRRTGKLISAVLLQDSLPCLASKEAQDVVHEISNTNLRAKLEIGLPDEQLEVRQAKAVLIRLEGNNKFFQGDISGALMKYSEALAVCPLKSKRDRVRLYNNRAQCYLVERKCMAAVSDLTRALCIDRKHKSSLWRRAQAYELLQLPKESLLDAIVYMKVSAGKDKRGIATYMDKLVRKQLHKVWLFQDAAERDGADLQPDTVQEDEHSEWETADEDELSL